MKKYELLLFDADDTLFDFHRAMCESLSKALDLCGVLCDDKILSTYEAINLTYWQRYEAGDISLEQLRNGRMAEFLSAAGIDYHPEKFNENYLNQLAHCSYLIDGAKSLCEDLSRKYRLAIVTNGISSMQHDRMDNSEIVGCFEHIFISCDTGYKKPEKGFFDHVFSFYGDVPREKMIIIGDSIGSDIKGGSDAGIATCWLNCRNEPRGTSVRVDYEIHSLAEVRGLFL